MHRDLNLFRGVGVACLLVVFGDPTQAVADAKLDADGTPALIIAAKRGEDALAAQTAALLLAFGADGSAVDGAKRIALEYAVDLPPDDFKKAALHKSHGMLVYALFETLMQRGQQKATDRGLAPPPPLVEPPRTAAAAIQTPTIRSRPTDTAQGAWCGAAPCPGAGKGVDCGSMTFAN